MSDRELLRRYLGLYRSIAREINSPNCTEQNRKEIQEIKNNIDYIISLVQIGSKKRKIIELRYKNGLNWRQIERTMHYSRSPLAEYEKKALDELVKIEAVKSIIHTCKII